MANGTTYLTRTNGSAVTAERRTFTISLWLKRCSTGTEHAVCTAGNGGGSEEFALRIRNDDTIEVWHYDGSSFVGRKRTNRVLRDMNAWYHIFCQYDTTESTADDRIKFYINGVRETSFADSVNPTSNDNTPWNVDERHQIGSSSWGNSGNGSNQFNGYMSHFYNVAGSIIDISQFGETDSTTGEWKIKTDPTIASYGTNGFLVLKDGITVTDQSPNSNNFTVGGGTLTKSEDCPSNVFATWNPLDKHIGGTAPSFSNGNNTWSSPGNGSSNAAVKGTIGASSGKYYFEAKFTAAQYTNAGMSLVDGANGWNGDGDIATQSSFYGIQAGGNKRVAGSNTSSVFTALSNNDIGMFAYDLDNNKFWFGVNGSWVASGNPTTGANSLGTLASGIYLPSISNGFWNQVSTAQFNFGNGYFGTTAVSSAGTNASNIGIFEYDVPTGFTALSTKGINSF